MLIVDRVVGQYEALLKRDIDCTIENLASNVSGCTVLYASWIDTPLGPMLAIGDEKQLYLLEFVGRRHLEREIERLRSKAKATIILGTAASIHSIKEELKLYFTGKLSAFKTPIMLLGTPFQQEVWQALQMIPMGESCSYRAIAVNLGRPTAFRAVAGANGANQLAIIIPCHRVINSDGGLGGYGGGLHCKEWLLNHERKIGHVDSK